MEVASHLSAEQVQVVARNMVFKGITLVTLNYRLGPLGEKKRLVPEFERFRFPQLH